MTRLLPPRVALLLVAAAEAVTTGSGELGGGGLSRDDFPRGFVFGAGTPAYQRPFGLSATSQQYFSLTTNQPLAISQQYFSLITNQHQPSATSQANRLQVSDDEAAAFLANWQWHIIILMNSFCRWLPSGLLLISGKARRRRTAGRPASGTPSHTPVRHIHTTHHTDATRFGLAVRSHNEVNMGRSLPVKKPSDGPGLPRSRSLLPAPLSLPHPLRLRTVPPRAHVLGVPASPEAGTSMHCPALPAVRRPIAPRLRWIPPRRGGCRPSLSNVVSSRPPVRPCSRQADARKATRALVRIVAKFNCKRTLVKKKLLMHQNWCKLLKTRCFLE
jgi:hypothetical protein